MPDPQSNPQLPDAWPADTPLQYIVVQAKDGSYVIKDKTRPTLTIESDEPLNAEELSSSFNQAAAMKKLIGGGTATIGPPSPRVQPPAIVHYQGNRDEFIKQEKAYQQQQYQDWYARPAADPSKESLPRMLYENPGYALPRISQMIKDNVLDWRNLPQNVLLALAAYEGVTGGFKNPTEEPAGGWPAAGPEGGGNGGESTGGGPTTPPGGKPTLSDIHQAAGGTRQLAQRIGSRVKGKLEWPGLLGDFAGDFAAAGDPYIGAARSGTRLGVQSLNAAVRGTLERFRAGRAALAEAAQAAPEAETPGSAAAAQTPPETAAPTAAPQATAASPETAAPGAAGAPTSAPGEPSAPEAPPPEQAPKSRRTSARPSAPAATGPTAAEWDTFYQSLDEAEQREANRYLDRGLTPQQTMDQIKAGQKLQQMLKTTTLDELDKLMKYKRATGK